MGNAEYMGISIDLSLCKMADERVTTQPEAHQVPHFTPDVQPVDEFGGNDGRWKAPSWQHIKHKWTSKEGWIGEFPLSYICTPQLPCSFRGKRSAKPTPFYALDADMPIMAAVVCGLQHCLAMLAGLITPPLIMPTQLGFDSQTQNQMVAVSLIVSGLLSAVQITRFRIPRTKYFVGTGLITVVGTSFATLSVASSIFNALYANGTCPSETVDGVVTRLACPEAYGYLLGTQGAPQGVSTCRDGSRGPSPWCEFGRQVGRLELGRWQQPLPEPPRGRLLLCLPQHGVRRCQAALGRRALPRPWSAVLLDDPHPRFCRLAFHALGKYHHWLACWLHRRGAPWLHLARHHRVCTCHRLPLGPDVPAQGLRPSCASHARRLHCSRL